MLVLSRRSDESIQFPSLGITVHILSLSPRRARIGIEAPVEFPIVRGEIAHQHHGAINSRQPKPQLGALRSQLHDAAAILGKLHQAVEHCDWEEAEPMVLEMFRELKMMDEQIATLSDGGRLSHIKKRALLVDDNANETRLLASFLRLKNFDVDTANDGGEALQQLTHDRMPDFVVLDMKMPKYDGPWTVRALRSRPRYKDLPIFAVSGLAPEDYDIKVGPSGVNQWFQKPLNPQELIDEISGQFCSQPSAV